MQTPTTTADLETLATHVLSADASALLSLLAAASLSETSDLGEHRALIIARTRAKPAFHAALNNALLASRATMRASVDGQRMLLLVHRYTAADLVDALYQGPRADYLLSVRQRCEPNELRVVLWLTEGTLCLAGHLESLHQAATEAARAQALISAPTLTPRQEGA